MIHSQIRIEINKNLDELLQKQYNENIIASKEKYMSLLNSKVTSVPASIVSSILQDNQSPVNKTASDETSVSQIINTKTTLHDVKMQNIIRELQAAATDGLNHLQDHKIHQMAEITYFFDSLIGSWVDQIFIEAQQRDCPEHSEILWIDVALIDHRMVSILNENKIEVENYFALELGASIDNIGPKIESHLELRKSANNENDLIASQGIELAIETICNFYNSELH